ncbi:MAG: hypothetical protein F4237_12535 [Gemmatimonadetes bacterium]|nr:hypothetical protein [Gemmatimonadota bacterium]
MTKFFGMMAVVATLLMGSVAVAEVVDDNESPADAFCVEINEVAKKYSIQDANVLYFRLYNSDRAYSCMIHEYKPAHTRWEGYWNGESNVAEKVFVPAQRGSDGRGFDGQSRK